MIFEQSSQLLDLTKILLRKVCYFSKCRPLRWNYFITVYGNRARYSKENCSEKEIWDTYNMTRDVEATFRCLKNDFDIRTFSHQNAYMAWNCSIVFTDCYNGTRRNRAPVLVRLSGIIRIKHPYFLFFTLYASKAFPCRIYRMPFLITGWEKCSFVPFLTLKVPLISKVLESTRQTFPFLWAYV